MTLKGENHWNPKLAKPNKEVFLERFLGQLCMQGFLLSLPFVLM